MENLAANAPKKQNSEAVPIIMLFTAMMMFFGLSMMAYLPPHLRPYAALHVYDQGQWKEVQNAPDPIAGLQPEADPLRDGLWVMTEGGSHLFWWSHFKGAITEATAFDTGAVSMLAPIGHEQALVLGQDVLRVDYPERAVYSTAINAERDAIVQLSGVALDDDSVVLLALLRDETLIISHESKTGDTLQRDEIDLRDLRDGGDVSLPSLYQHGRTLYVVYSSALLIWGDVLNQDWQQSQLEQPQADRPIGLTSHGLWLRWNMQDGAAALMLFEADGRQRRFDLEALLDADEVPQSLSGVDERVYLLTNKRVFASSTSRLEDPVGGAAQWDEILELASRYGDVRLMAAGCCEQVWLWVDPDSALDNPPQALWRNIGILVALLGLLLMVTIPLTRYVFFRASR